MPAECLPSTEQVICFAWTCSQHQLLSRGLKAHNRCTSMHTAQQQAPVGHLHFTIVLRALRFVGHNDEDGVSLGDARLRDTC